MIVVKLKSTLRVKGSLKIAGSVFRGDSAKDLPEWLQAEIKHCKAVSARNTLLIQETAVKAAPIASDGDEKAKEDAAKAEADAKEKKEAPKPKAAKPKAAKKAAKPKAAKPKNGTLKKRKKK